MSLDVYLRDPETDEELYESNITHNLGEMADAAVIYEILWRPEEFGISTAGQIVGPLAAGIARMATDREKFEAYNSPNGWGMYKSFLPWLQDYLKACRQYPDAKVSVCR